MNPDPLANQWRSVHEVVNAPLSPLPWAQPAAAPEHKPEPVPTAAVEPAVEEDKSAEDKPGFIDTWSPRLALAATIGLTASGEFALAQLAGWHPGIAWLLPTAIDVYVVQSFRRHRDVAAALTLMVVANAVYHLADRGLFGVATKGGEIVRNASGDPRPTWWLIVGVAAIAPLVMWRIHRITAPKPERRERARVEPASAPTQAVVSVERERSPGRPPVERPALTERARPEPSERAQATPTERARERTTKPKSERARGKRKSAPNKAAGKTLTDRRRERVRALYDELGKRPEWTDIRDALTAAKLSDKPVSRPTAQRIRDAVESKEPALAALGSDNVRPLNQTGS